jgi:hypothetical protein
MTNTQIFFVTLKITGVRIAPLKKFQTLISLTKIKEWDAMFVFLIREQKQKSSPI